MVPRLRLSVGLIASIMLAACGCVFADAVSVEEKKASAPKPAAKPVAKQNVASAKNVSVSASEAETPAPANAERENERAKLAVSDIETWRQGPKEAVKLSDIPIAKTVVRPSEYYGIAEDVDVNSYFYEFTVAHAGQETKVLSVRELVKFCHEIEMIERYKTLEQGSHVMEGMGQAATGIGRGFVNLFRHPGQSLKRAGQGLGRFGRATGSLFKGKDETVPVIAADGSNRAEFGAGPAGGERRLLSWELGIDVYTQNQQTREFINRVARKRFSGKLPLNASVFALPGGSIFTLSLTPMGFDPTTEDIIRDFSPDELRRQLSLKYKEQFGLSYKPETSVLTALLDNPNYSPREQAYLWRYLTDLSSLEGRDDAIKFLSQVSHPEHARIVSAQIELLALLHERGKPLQRFVPVRNTLGALAKDGSLCMVISIDTVRLWGDVRTSLESTLAAAKAYGAAKSQIWSTGDIDAESVALAKGMGVEVYQNIIAHPVFQKPRQETIARENEQKEKMSQKEQAGAVSTQENCQP